MARAERNWERLVRAALRGERLVGGAYGHPATGIAGIVPSSLGNNTHIEEVLRTADEIQDEDPTVARILCEHAYALAQNLDPNSEGRGVLQFKTGLMSVIRQKLAKRDGAAIDRSQDIAKLQEFYKLYREKHKVDELIADEMKLRESAVFSGNLGELEQKTLKRKKVLATLKVLWSVIEDMTKEISPEDAEKLISEEAHIYTTRGRILETILSLRIFIFQFGVVYHMNAADADTSLLVYWISWAVLGGLLFLLLVFGLNPKAMEHFQLFLRLIKSIALLMVLAGLVLAIVSCGAAPTAGAGKISNILPISNICPIGNIFSISDICPIGNI